MILEWRTKRMLARLQKALQAERAGLNPYAKANETMRCIYVLQKLAARAPKKAEK